MASRGKKILMGCGIGCAASVLLTIIVTVGGGLLMMRPFNQAIDDQKALTDAFGASRDYRPPAEGVTPDRLDRFLAVRRAVMPQCEGFEEISRAFAGMDELDKGGDEPSAGEALGAVGNVMGVVFGIAGKIGEFNKARNAALLAQEMGLGEYVWIYTLAYHSYLGAEPQEEFGSAESDLSDRAAGLIRTLMANHEEALRQAGRDQEADSWSEERDRLHRFEEAVPFPGGALPAELAEVFAARRDELEMTYCAPMAGFEFGEVERKGLSIRSRVGE